MPDTNSTTYETRSSVRYWKRTEMRAGWWPWGLLPLIALLIIFLTGATVTAKHMEANVVDEVSQRLMHEGFAFQASGDGQSVSITAIAPEEQRSFINALARSTTCATWVGDLACPTAVTVSLKQVQEPGATDTQEPHLSAAADHPGSLDAAFQTEQVAVTPPIATASTCNAEFAAIFAESRIQFRSNSAELQLGNDRLIDSIAEVAARCPGRIIIAGHTDSRGNAGMNQALSKARAESVRAALISRGIEYRRIEASGFGETRPVADNHTSAGRAMNRRIAISVQQE